MTWTSIALSMGTKHATVLLNNQIEYLDYGSSWCFLDRYLELEMFEFTLHEVLVASVSKVMMKSNGKGIRIVHDAEEDVMTETLYGDSLRLQQVLSNFLSIAVNTTSSGSVLVVAARLARDQLGESVHLGKLELRYLDNIF